MLPGSDLLRLLFFLGKQPRNDQPHRTSNSPSFNRLKQGTLYLNSGGIFGKILVGGWTTSEQYSRQIGLIWTPNKPWKIYKIVELPPHRILSHAFCERKKTRWDFWGVKVLSGLSHKSTWQVSQCRHATPPFLSAELHWSHHLFDWLVHRDSHQATKRQLTTLGREFHQPTSVNQPTD